MNRRYMFMLLHIITLIFNSVILTYLIDYLRPEILIVGNVTIDVFNKQQTTGGASSYAAAVVEAHGMQSYVISAAGPDADLSIFKNHQLRVIDDISTLTFKHDYTWWGNNRVLHVLEKPTVKLSIEHVPLLYRFSKIVILAPLLPMDIDTTSFLQYSKYLNYFYLTQKIGLIAQGYQRDLDKNGKVIYYTQPNPSLLESLNEHVSVFLSDVETEPWSQTHINEVIRKCERLIITRGPEGAEEHKFNSFPIKIPVAKVDEVEDTNGAGDSFATAYMIGLLTSLENPGEHAANLAARTITKPQKCKPWCISDKLEENLNFKTKIQLYDYVPSLLKMLGIESLTIKKNFSTRRNENKAAI